MADENEKGPETKTENPGGLGFPENPDQLNRSYGRNVQPDEAEAAADRALEDQPVTAREIREQSGYKDQTVDVAQEAGEAEREEGDEGGEAAPRAFPDAKP